jgi:2'-5' RNA ligase
VIWLGLAGETDRLAALRQSVVTATRRLGFAAEERPFAPHVTLGRVREQATGADRARVGRAARLTVAPAPADWPVADLVLMLSTLGRGGATYQPLGRWQLGGLASRAT